jgi:Ca2+:H+ antiporter
VARYNRGVNDLNISLPRLGPPDNRSSAGCRGSEQDVILEAMRTDTQREIKPLWRSEWILAVSVPSAVFFFFRGEMLLGDLTQELWYSIIFLWVFLVMLCSAFSVVRHAEALAGILGEPYGTLILTLSVIGIEVVVIAEIMLHGDNNPTLARDTMFSVLMIVLNGMVGISILLGGLRHHEQSYNLQGAGAYMGVLLPLSLLSLVLPRLTGSAPGGQVSNLLGYYLIAATILLYLVFLGIQVVRHRDFFQQPLAVNQAEQVHRREAVTRNGWTHAALLLITMLPIVLLAEPMASLVDHGLGVLHAPAAAGGFLVAILVLSAEGMTALRAALSNQLQRSINICLGSALSTIGLTIPCVLAIGMITGRSVVLGLGPVDIFLLALTLLVSMVTFGSGRTSVLQGFVHLLLFATYVVSIFDSV